MRTRDQREGQYQGGGATINAQFCPFCGKPRPDPSAVFCAYCGRSVAATPGSSGVAAAPGISPPPPAPQFAPPQFATPQYTSPPYGQYAMPPAGMPQPTPMIYSAPPGWMPYATRKSVGVAILLETLLPGVGELYLGRVGMGLVWLLGTPAVFGVLYAWQMGLVFGLQLYERQVLAELIVMSLTWYAARIALVIGDTRAHNLSVPGLPVPIGNPGRLVTIAIIVVLLALVVTLYAHNLVGGLIIPSMVGAAFWLALQRLPYARRGQVCAEIMLFGLSVYLVSVLLNLAYLKDHGADVSYSVFVVRQEWPLMVLTVGIATSLAFALAVLAAHWPAPQPPPATTEVLRSFPLAALCLITVAPLFVLDNYLSAFFYISLFGIFNTGLVVLSVCVLLVYVIVGSVMTARRFKSGAGAR